jgi:hypothetical protein
MPLPEEFSALFVIAGEHTRQAASQRIGKLHLAETLGVRNVHFGLEGGEVDSLTVHNDQLSLRAQTISSANPLLS